MSYRVGVKISREGSCGVVTVGTSVTRLSNSSVHCRVVIIKADDDNSGNVYVGFDENVTTSTGFRLKAGQGVELVINNLNKIYLIADSDDQKVYYVYTR